MHVSRETMAQFKVSSPSFNRSSVQSVEPRMSLAASMKPSNDGLVFGFGSRRGPERGIAGSIS
jgi:hypothetical protein